MVSIDAMRLRRELSRVVGPAPWYWETFPAVVSSAGEKLVWMHHGAEGPLAYLVSLAPEHDADRPRLALNTYCRPFTVGTGTLGIWCPEGRNLRLACFDVAALESFDLAEVAGWFKQSAERMYATSAPTVEFEVSASLSPGMHQIEVPAPFRAVEELIAPTTYPARSAEDAAMALYVFYLHAGLVEVLPQNWFTAGKRDGYEWITRAARDAESHRIFGDGIRIKAFLLQEDGTQLDRWLDSE